MSFNNAADTAFALYFTGELNSFLDLGKPFKGEIKQLTIEIGMFAENPGCLVLCGAFAGYQHGFNVHFGGEEMIRIAIRHGQGASFKDYKRVPL